MPPVDITVNTAVSYQIETLCYLDWTLTLDINIAGVDTPQKSSQGGDNRAPSNQR